MIKLPVTYGNLFNLVEKEIPNVKLTLTNQSDWLLLNNELLFRSCSCLGTSTYPRVGLIDKGTEAQIKETLVCDICSLAWRTNEDSEI